MHVNKFLRTLWICKVAHLSAKFIDNLSRFQVCMFFSPLFFSLAPYIVQAHKLSIHFHWKNFSMARKKIFLTKWKFECDWRRRHTSFYSGAHTHNGTYRDDEYDGKGSYKNSINELVQKVTPKQTFIISTELFFNVYTIHRDPITYHTIAHWCTKRRRRRRNRTNWQCLLFVFTLEPNEQRNHSYRFVTRARYKLPF